MTATVTTLVATAGTTNGYHSQRQAAHYYNGKTYFAYMTAAGSVAVRSWNHATETMSAEVILKVALSPGDSHAVPVLLVRSSDHKIVVWYCDHNGAAMYQRVSTNAEDISAFDAEVDLDAQLGGTSSLYTYPQVVELGSTLYLFYRRLAGGIDTEWAYSTSTNGGTTWATETVFATEPSHWSYVMVSKTSTSRIDFSYIDRSTFDETGGSVYHFYMTGGSFYKSDGTLMSGIPFAASDMTQVWASNGTQCGVYGPVEIGGDGLPRMAFGEYESISPEDQRYMYGAYDGSSWTVNQVAAAGSGAQTTNIAIEPGTSNVVWYSRDVVGTTQIFRAHTADNGETWHATQVSSGSNENGLVNPVLDADESLLVFWQSLAGGWTRNDTIAANFLGASWAAEPGVWVDWAGDGVFGSSADDDAPLARMLPEGRTVNDDITADVHRFDWSYGGAADHVSGTNPGRATIVVQNSDGKYTPENTSSSLYGYLLPGKRVWIGLNEDGTATGTGQTVHGVFSGYIREIVPLVEDGATAFAELLCDDPTATWVDRPVKVTAATDYSYGSLRRAVLADIGETQLDLDREPDTLPLAAADSDNALSVLGEIDKATGSRSWWNPGDSKEAFGAYATRHRHHKLQSSTDASINSDDVQAISGYRVTLENVVNYQQADVSPARFPAGIDTVWTYAEATFPLTSKRTIWAQFDDFVKDATLDFTSTGGAVTSVLTNFGTTAKIELWSASSSVVQNLEIEGRMVQRDAAEAVTSEDTASQQAYGKRAGARITSTYAGTTALAQGVADFAVWKFKQPRKRPGITQIHEPSASLSRDMYDTIAYTLDRLNVSGRRFEIVGISGSYAPGPLLTVSWELQETPNQAALDLFTLGTSDIGGADVLAY